MNKDNYIDVHNAMKIIEYKKHVDPEYQPIPVPNNKTIQDIKSIQDNTYRIQQEKIIEIQKANDIVEVIGSYIELKKSGKEYKGLCPFHKDSNPSFTVSIDKQVYHCFGCNEKGNVITFLEKYKGLSFVESLQELAKRVGINLAFQESEQDKDREYLYELNNIATEYFNDKLHFNQQAKSYFLNRGITEQTIKDFQLGYSIDSWTDFLDYAKSKELDLELLYKLGLIGKKEKGYYDSFKGRLMFPIFNVMGRVAGFGARQLQDNNNYGKYINSKDSDVYHKSNLLYGLNFSKSEIQNKGYAILVEGYIDCLTLFQNGIKNIIATCGTALTDEQLKALGRYTKNLTFVYDGDGAGKQATKKNFANAVKDFDIKIVSLKNNQDPDSYVRNYGVEKFQELLDKAVSPFEMI